MEEDGCRSRDASYIFVHTLNIPCICHMVLPHENILSYLIILTSFQPPGSSYQTGSMHGCWTKSSNTCDIWTDPSLSHEHIYVETMNQKSVEIPRGPGYHLFRFLILAMSTCRCTVSLHVSSTQTRASSSPRGLLRTRRGWGHLVSWKYAGGSSSASIIVPLDYLMLHWYTSNIVIKNDSIGIINVPASISNHKHIMIF